MSSEPMPIEKCVFEVIEAEYKKLCTHDTIPFYMSGSYGTNGTVNRIAQIMCDLKEWETEIDWNTDWSNRRKISICASLTLAHCRGIICQIQQQNATVYKKLVKLQHKLLELDEAIEQGDQQKRDKAVGIISDLLLAHAKFFIGTGVALVTMNPVPAYLTAAALFTDVAVSLQKVFSINEVDVKIQEYRSEREKLNKNIRDAKTEIDKSIEYFLK